MRKLYLLTALLVALSINTEAQKKKPATSNPNGTAVVVDSTLEISGKEIAEEGVAVVTLDDNELDNSGSGNVSSMLTAGRDPFYSAVSYNFFPVRYRYRGYDGNNSSIYMNGMPLENLENGYSQFGLFSGLNDVVRNREVSIGLKSNSFAYGSMGTTTNFDTRSSKQRSQTQFGYTNSNGNFSHRWSLTHSTGMNKNGWAFTFSGSHRWSDENYIPGTYTDSWSYFVGVDKRINSKQLLSFVTFNAINETGGASSETKEAYNLVGNNYYNSFWGWQMGKKRNAHVRTSNTPVFILTHDFKINPKTSLVTTAGYTTGTKGSTAIDWINAADPRPNYYAYMPSEWLFHGNSDTVMYNYIQQLIQADPNILQINWNNLYQSNRNARDTVKGLNGHRSHYILADNITATNRFNFSTTFNTTISQRFLVTGGLSYQAEVNEHYKVAKDLLGGDYMVDLNSFAQFDYHTPKYNQQDTVVRQGGRYGYDYEMHLNKAAGWLQGIYKFNHLDVFFAAELSNTQFYRKGLFKNDLFAATSQGKSDTYNFNNYSIKGGMTYKINGRNYLFLNEYFATIAPNYRNVFLSPNTRSQVQDQITSESIKSMEAGYVLIAPKLKMKLTTYYTESDNEMQVRSYYDDELVNNVNVALRNVDKVHYGAEIGVEVKPIANVTVNGAVGISRSYFSSRQFATSTIDNVDSIVSRDTVYSKNFRIGGTPQEVFTLAINYRSPKYWYVSVSCNYFDELWTEMSPIRREYRTSTGAPYQSAQWKDIVSQEQLPSNYMVDLSAGYSWKLPRSFGLKKATFVNFNLGINNLFDNKNIVAGGYEQLRFDSRYFQAGAFPNKYSYAMGINYHIGMSIRF